MSETFHAYEVDDGATYWVAARSMREAIDTMWRHYEDTMDLEFREDYPWSVERCPDERARKVFVDMDGDGTRSVWSLAQSVTEPQIVGCSEW